MLNEILEWYDLTEEERAIRDLALQVAREEIAPRAEKHDLEGTFVRDSIDALGESGLLGVNVPKKYGGLGGGRLATVLAVEAVSAACGSTGASYFFHVGATNLLNGSGPEELRQKYLPQLARDKLGAFAINEGNAVFADWMESSIEDRGDHYILNGSKPFVTSAGAADLYMAHVQRPETPYRGFWGMIDQEYIVVNGHDPGVSSPQTYDSMGLRGASNGSMKFENVRIPKEDVLGEEPFGFFKVLPGKEASAVGPHTVAMGIAGAALDAAVRHTRQKGDEEWIRHLIAQMSSRLDALRSYNYFAARATTSNFYEAAQRNQTMRVLGGEDGPWICERAMEIMGGSSYMRSSPIQRYYRDAMGTTYLMFPMDQRRRGVAVMRIARDAEREFMPAKSMPWSHEAEFVYRQTATRARLQYPQGMQFLALPAVEQAARSQGFEEVTLDFYMPYLIAFVERVEGTGTPEGVPAGVGAGGPPRGGPPGGAPPFGGPQAGGPPFGGPPQSGPPVERQ